jgi:hypothetical protein
MREQKMSIDMHRAANKRKVCDSPMQSPMQSLSRILEGTDLCGSRPPVTAELLGHGGGTMKSHRSDTSLTSSPSASYEGSSADDDSFRRLNKSDDFTWTARRTWSIHHRDPDTHDAAGSSRRVSPSDSRTAPPTNLQRRVPCVTVQSPLHLARAPVLQPSCVDATTSSSVAQTLGLAPSSSRQRAAGLTALSSLSIRR